MRIELPPEVAHELLGEDLCTLPLTQRGAAADVAVAVTVVGVAGNLSSVLVAGPALRAFVSGLLHAAWHGRPDRAATSVDLRLTQADGSEVRVEITGINDARAAEVLQRALHDAIGD
jgi:hypothetical protein